MRLFFKDFAQCEIGKWTEKKQFSVHKEILGQWATGPPITLALSRSILHTYCVENT